jgi:hypothetical protein
MQIDGGPENANKYVLALCEFLVARRLTGAVFLTRLPVGHTHEDIDARFGALCIYIRNRVVLSPGEYEEAMKKCFGTKKSLFNMVDIFCTPNYKAFFEPYIDRKVSNFTNEEDTQLAWKFEAVKRSNVFPLLSVRTMYRSYASGQVYETVRDPNSKIDEVQFGVCKTICRWQPVVNGQAGMGISHDGINIMSEFPLGPIIPSRFKPGHPKEFEATTREINMVNFQRKIS